MIISVSRRTDIPAFYSEWFMKRIEDGYFHVINPFNVHMVRRFSILPNDVDVLVFWSKNPKPLMQYLEYLDVKGYRYYFQFTLNDYPRLFEPRVPPIEDRIETFRRLSDKIGSKRVIWRYDPIILSSITPIEYHIKKLTDLARNLKGYTKRLVISFVDFYGKVEHRFNKLSIETDIKFMDLTTSEYRGDLETLCAKITGVARMCDMDVFSCAEALNLKSFGIEGGSCIDVNLINDLFMLRVETPKDRSQRPECLCAESVDLGVYNTCKFQCAYCYANFSENMISINIRKHKSDSPSLIGEHHGKVITTTIKKTAKTAKQLSLFDSKDRK